MNLGVLCTEQVDGASASDRKQAGLFVTPESWACNQACIKEQTSVSLMSRELLFCPNMF